MARVLLAAVALWFSLRAPRSPGGGTVTTWPARQDSPVEGPAWPGLVARIRGLVGNGLHCLGRLQLDIQWPEDKCNFWNSTAFDPIPARWPDLCAGRPLILTRKCCRQNSNLEDFVLSEDLIKAWPFMPLPTNISTLPTAQCVLCTVFFPLDRTRWDIS